MTSQEKAEALFHDWMIKYGSCVADFRQQICADVAAALDAVKAECRKDKDK